MKLIKLQSRSDVSHALSLHEQWDGALDAKEQVRVDVGAVGLLGAAVAQLLVVMQNTLKAGGGVMELCNVTEVVREDLAALGLINHFTLVD